MSTPGHQAPPPPPPQQQPGGAVPNLDVQQKQADIGQASAAPAGALCSYETIPRDDGIGHEPSKYKNPKKLESLD